MPKTEKEFREAIDLAYKAGYTHGCITGGQEQQESAELLKDILIDRYLINQ